MKETFMPETKIEMPLMLTSENVIYWSDHWKKMEKNPTNDKIKKEALEFLKENKIEYSKELKCYIVHDKPFDCNIKNIKGEFVCTCAGTEMCSHILALYLLLKIWNHNKKSEAKL